MKIISADHVLPVSAPPIAGGAVAYDAGRIVGVGPRALITAAFPNAEHEDFGPAAILPGLVNVHSHLELTALRGFADEFDDDFHNWLIKVTTTRGERLGEREIEISALAGAREGARAGITCFGDIGRHGSAGVKALVKSGLRGIVFQETEFSPDNRTAGEDFDQLRRKFEALRECETPLVRIGLSPHAPYTVSARLFGLIADFAIAENINLTIHASESVMEEDLMLYGTGFFAGVYEGLGHKFESPGESTIGYLGRLGVLRARPLLAHCVRVTDADIDLIVTSGSGVAHCPKSNAKFGHGPAPFGKFLERGAKVGFGSDSMASNNVCDLFEEARFATLLARNADSSAKFLQPADLIETATLGGARALGLDSVIGSLESGKQADLIVVGLGNLAQTPVHDVNSALVFASNARDVRLTIVAGEEVVRDGRFRSADDSNLLAEFSELAARMRGGGQ
jgi:5-methylthioadenosine/S-adenosylhomocysteine deaminase